MGEANPKQDDAVDEAFVDELKAGTELMHGQYTIESFLNAGGFGITYNARDSLDRRVVIKECFPGAFCRRSRYLVNARSRAHQSELESIVRLFVQEAKSLSKLDHPNIVGVHNVFEENNTAYMALDFVEGRDLLDIIEDDDATLTPDEVNRILREILGAIAFIHDQGILHRDISPDNILVDSNKHPVLIDFGAAREQATKQSRVLSALRVVKDGYSPQEFYIQGSDQGPFSDLYALGASFYHVIAGDVPPNSQARLAAIASGQADPYEPLKGNVPGLDDNFLEAIDRSLAVLPKDRLQSAQEWLSMMDGKADPIAATVANTIRESKEVNARAARTATSRPMVNVAPVLPAVDPAGAEIKKTKAGALLATTAVLALVAGAVVFTRMGGEEVADGAVVPAVAEVAPDTAAEAVIDTTVAEVEPVEVVEAAPETVVEAEPVVAAEAAPEVVLEAEPEVVAEAEPEVIAEAEPVVVAEVEPEVIAEAEPVVVAEVEPEVVVEAPIVDAPVATAEVVEEPAADPVEDVFDVAVADQATETLSADTVASEPVEDGEEIVDIFEAAAALASGDEPAVAETVNRQVSGDPSPIVAPVGAAEGVSSGPFESDLALVSEPVRPAVDPAVRPEGLGQDVLELASNTSVGGQVSAAQGLGAEAGFPEILPEPIATPVMPTDATTQTDFADADGAFALPSMDGIPLLPASFVGPLGMPSSALPVFPFAPELLSEPTPEVAAAEPEQRESIQSVSTPVLPFNGLFSAELNETRIYSVNGVAVDSLVQFNNVVRETEDLNSLTEVNVTIETGLVGEGIQQLQTLTLPVLQEVRLSDGTQFEIAQVGDKWETRVVAIPETAETDLAVGDVILAYVSTSELLTERTTIADLIARESEAGISEFSFAVLRDGATWVASMTYEDPTAAGQD